MLPDRFVILRSPDEPAGGAAPAAPAAPVPAAAPVAAAPAPAVASTDPVAPAIAPVEAAKPAADAPKPAESAAPAADAKPGDKPAADAPKAPESKPSLLSEAGKPAPDKPAEPAGDAAPAQPEPAAAPAPTYEKFTLPEGVNLGEKELTNFTGILGEFEQGSKAEHGKVQEFGQKLVDLYVQEVQTLATRLRQQQVEVWNDQNAQWVEQVRSDPELGGNRIATTLNACGAVIEQYGGNPQQIAELRQAFNATGAGNHPAIVRLMHNIGKSLAVEGRPVPAQKPAPAPAGKAQRRYAGTGGQ